MAQGEVRRSSLVALLAVVVIISAAACSKGTPSATGTTGTTTETPTDQPSGSGSGDDGGTMQIGNDQANDHGSADVAGKTKTKVEQDNFYFKPTVLSGAPSQGLTIEIENEGSVPHTFTIDAQNIDVVVQPGESATADVTFPDGGVVEFYCRFHHGSGMAGGLKVA